LRILILGASGMLGHTIFRTLSSTSEFSVWGSIRSSDALRFFPEHRRKRLLSGVDALDFDALSKVLESVRPDAVVNCIGLIKQLANADDPLIALPPNAILPHRLARLCGLAGARLIHVSTDCVFSGNKGGYLESDLSDAEDLYGKSKYIGELHDLPHAITLRTSVIGHEINSAHALIDWFLAQNGVVKGFSHAVFSGLPTVEFARVIRDFVLPQAELSGLYHLAAEPISKLDLLRLVAAQYGKSIEIVPDDRLVIDRSLNGSHFNSVTGYAPPTWPELVSLMYLHRDG
jgi:dTDP-4-dehydrorhamnose reductase